MKARFSLLTIGVDDLERSLKFYRIVGQEFGLDRPTWCRDCGGARPDVGMRQV